MTFSPSTPDEIRVRAFESPLGTMLGGATERGICLCEFADRGGEERIFGRLRKRHRREVTFFQPSRTGPEGASAQGEHLEILEGQVTSYFAGTLREFDLTLDLGGTPWQKQVWSALLTIPFGSTCSYGELAATLGKPGAGRAVGRANGENYVSIVVPCHRVIQADGGLRGYGGGLHRKRWLLDLERGTEQLSL